MAKEKYPSQENIDLELAALEEESVDRLYHGYGIPFGANGEAEWPLPENVTVGDIVDVETDGFEQPRGHSK